MLTHLLDIAASLICTLQFLDGLLGNTERADTDCVSVAFAAGIRQFQFYRHPGRRSRKCRPYFDSPFFIVFFRNDDHFVQAFWNIFEDEPAVGIDFTVVHETTVDRLDLDRPELLPGRGNDLAVDL